MTTSKINYTKTTQTKTTKARQRKGTTTKAKCPSCGGTGYVTKSKR